MSTHQPSQPEPRPEPQPEPQSEPEYVGTGGPGAAGGAPPSGRRSRRAGLVTAAAVAVVAAVGVGAYGVVALMSGGSSPATAVPADAVGYVGLDLDPSASQKIEAFKILRKFPAIKKELRLGGHDDLRKTVFDEFRRDSDCKGLDYAKDVEPWIGDRVALAAVPDSGRGVLPLVVLQVGDQEKAKAGTLKLESCDDGGEKPGIAFVGDYLLVAETQKQADSMAKDAETAALADDKEFSTAMGRTGAPGIVTMYASQDAPDAFLTAEQSETRHFAGGGGSNAEMTKQFEAMQRKQTDQFRSMFKDFQGAAGVVRFADGAVEAELTGKGLPSNVGAVGGEGGPDVATLPGSTAAAFSVAFRKGWLKDYLEQMNQMLGGGESLDEMMAEGEKATGLQLPEDLETLLGDGLSFSVDGTTDLKALTESPDPTQVPAGIRIKGDPAKITPIIDKLKRAAGPDGDMVKVSSGDGMVAVGLDPDYVGSLLEKGDLGGVRAFDDVVPRADHASSVLYVNFDAGDGWADQMADLLSDGDPGAKENVAPLDALGVSAWMDDDQVSHGLLRLTTD